MVQSLKSATVGLILFALVQSVLLIFLVHRPDFAIFSDDYLSLAEIWRTCGTYSSALFGPGYPFLLTRLLALTDHYPITVWTGVAVQFLCGLGTVLFTSHLTLALTQQPRTARLAALLVAADPVFLIYHQKLVTEPLFTLLLLLLVTVTLCPRIKTRAVLNGAAIGLLIAALLLTRGSGLVVAMIFAFYLAAYRAWGRVAVAGVLVGATILTWSTHNAAVNHRFQFSSSADYNFAALFIGEAKAMAEGIPPAATLEIWRNELTTDGILLDPAPSPVAMHRFDVAEAARKHALTWAFNHPGTLAVAVARAEALAFIGPADYEWSSLTAPSDLRRDGFIAERALVTILAGIGFFVLIRRRPDAGLLMLACIAAQILPTGSGAYSRFLVPGIPLIACCAAIGFMRITARSSPVQDAVTATSTVVAINQSTTATSALC